MLRTATILLATFLVLVPLSASAGPYEDAFARAVSLEEQGEYEAAAAELAALVETYPQDYPLQLQIAWLQFQAGRYDQAERAYRRALDLSGGALDPTLGLGWTLLRLGRTDEARAYFDQVLARDPDNASAAEGLHAIETPAVPSRATTDFGLFIGATGRAYQSAAKSDLAGGPVVGASVRHGRLTAGVTYRMFQFKLEPDTPGHRYGRDDSEFFFQNEVYGALVYARPAFGMSLHYGHVDSGIDGGLDADVAGAIGRVDLLGRVTLEGSYSAYPEADIVRVAPAWRIPLGDFYVQPAAGYQRVLDTESTYWIGALAAGLQTSAVTAEVGAKYGQEWRPTYLSIPVAYNVDAVLQWGGWAGLTVSFAESWGLVAGYSLEHYEASVDEPSFDGHVITLGVERRAF